ncbi:hypothetical protein AAF712_003719 [Marasmius tenuissimus]|uniref:Uncharacterized protein n=1 Tax=Marasmius tenuissimus TaxID=585030 RepID=A0ABR3A8R6_9AGAR
MFKVISEFIALALSGCPLSKWLNRVLHPPTVAVEEAIILIPTRTSLLLPSKSLDVPIVNQGSDTLWLIGLGLLVLVFLSSLALVSQKAWARRALVLAFTVPTIALVTLRPALLEALASLDAVVLRDNILDWLGLPIDATASMSAPPAAVVGCLIQDMARLADFFVYWSDQASIAANIIKSRAIVLGLYIVKNVLAIVVSAVKALQTVTLPTKDQLLTSVNAHWSFLALRSCMETVTYRFMSSLTAHRPSSRSNSLFQLLKSLRIAFFDARKAFTHWLSFNIRLFLESYVMVTWTLAVIIFVRKDDIVNYARRSYILDKICKIPSIILSLESGDTFYPMFGPFSYEFTVTLPNREQVKACDLRSFRIERGLWDDSRWFDREEVGAPSKGGWYEKTWKYGYAWFNLYVVVAPKVGSDATPLLP